MTTKLRRQKEKEDMRQQILDVSKEIAAKDGWQNLTIRKICAKINYTAPVIYQYFGSKDHILISLREDGFVQIFEAFNKVDRKHKNPSKRLLEYGNVWWDFSKNNPELYQVMFNLQGAVCSSNGNAQSNRIVDYYNAVFIQINPSVAKNEKLKLELCDNIIAIIHGFIAMRMVNKIKSGKENADNAYQNALKRFINSIKITK